MLNAVLISTVYPPDHIKSQGLIIITAYKKDHTEVFCLSIRYCSELSTAWVFCTGSLLAADGDQNIQDFGVNDYQETKSTGDGDHELDNIEARAIENPSDQNLQY